MDNQAYRISVSRMIAGKARQAFRVMEEIDRFPEFMPNVNKLTILEDSGNRKVAEWDTCIDDTPLNWIEEGTYDADNLTISFHAREGVFARFDGCWRVIPETSGCKIEFELVYEIGLPEIEEMIAPLLHERLVANVESMLTAIASRTKTSV